MMFLEVFMTKIADVVSVYEQYDYQDINHVCVKAKTIDISDSAVEKIADRVLEKLLKVLDVE